MFWEVECAPCERGSRFGQGKVLVQPLRAGRAAALSDPGGCSVAARARVTARQRTV